MEIKIKYTKDCTKIYDSYKYNVHEVVDEIMKSRYEIKLPITRDHTSYAREIRGHNRLYKLGIARSHTKDVDLEENIAKWKELVWRIIGG